MRSNIQVGTNLPYGKFIDQGPAPSEGRFVPVLGRRLITPGPGFGSHPGVRARNFISATKLEMDVKIGGMIAKFLNDWRRGLRL
jgi:hypothetical protein